MTVLAPFVTRNSFNNWMQDFDRLLEPVLKESHYTQLQADIVETDEHIMMSFDFPGLSEDDFKVSVDQDLLTISGERKRVETDEAKGVRYYGRQYGKFQRSFTLPDTIDKEKIEADYRAGVLHVLLPKMEPKKNNILDVKVKSKNSAFDKLLSFK